MPTRRVNDQTYQEIAIVAGQPIPVDIGGSSVNVTLPASLEIQNDSGNPIPASVATVGATDDAAATTDTGTFTLLALFKRLLSKTPALSNGAVPVAPAVQQGGGAITATTQRVTLASDGPGVAALNSLDVKTPALSNGRQPVEASVPARTPTTTSVASSTSSVLLLAANSNRRAFTIYNESTAVLRISDSNPATNGNHFATLQPGGFYAEDLQGFTTGAIYGIWTAANGSAQLRELV